MSNDTELKKKLEERETSPGTNLGISDSVSRAETMLKNQLSAKPGAYQSAWQTQLDDTINKIMNRQKFTYDLNGDALYQQYKDKYIQQGQMAMMDTMGQAQAMTGGYGNSYAQSVGQQAYQGHLQNLNDIVPELYKLALDNYNTEGQNLLNQYAMLGAQDEQDYGRYRDRVGDYNADLGFAYQNWRDLVGDQQWQTQFDEAKRQYDQEWAKQNGSFSGPSTPYSGFNNGNVDAANIKLIQEYMGMSGPDLGKWGPKSRAAALKAFGTEDPDEAYKKYLEMQKGSEFASGIDTVRDQSGFKGSSWDMTKNNLRQQIEKGRSYAEKYMDMIVDQMSESQFIEAYDMIYGKGAYDKKFGGA